MSPRLSSLLSALALATALASTPALAQEANEVGARLKTAFSQQGLDFDYASISGDTSEMTVEGVKVKSPGEDTFVDLAPITLNNVGQEGDVVTIGSMVMESHSVAQAGLNVSVDGIEVTNLKLPPEGADQVATYESADVGEVVVRAGDKQVFDLSNMSIQVTPNEGGPIQFVGSADRFSADLTAIEDPNTRRVVEALGYQTVAGSLDMAGSWNPADGRVTLSQYDLNVDDAGTIGISIDLGGYTPEFQKALRDTQTRLAASEQDQAAGMAMLGLMQQLTFHGATIRFDDATLTGKVLDYFAAQQGAKRTDIANQAKAILPFLLAQLNNPEFAAQVTSAASSFLDSPKSLTISARPSQPVPFALLAATAMSAPQGLPQQLGVTVSAND